MNASLIPRQDIFDKSATITVLDNIPFSVNRIFYIHSSELQHDRGDHAHRKCHQIYICVRGSISVECIDGVNQVEYILTDKSDCLYVPPMVWSREKKFDKDTIFLVLCSEIYDEHDYIRSFDIFLEENNEEEKKSMG